MGMYTCGMCRRMQKGQSGFAMRQKLWLQGCGRREQGIAPECNQRQRTAYPRKPNVRHRTEQVELAAQVLGSLAQAVPRQG